MGRPPVSNDCSNIKRNTEASSLASLWSNFPGIPSGPQDFLVFIPSINLKTPCSVICRSLIGGKGFPVALELQLKKEE